MLVLLVLAVSVYLTPIITQEEKLILFNETFICSNGENLMNTYVTVQVCEYDLFAFDDCTPWETKHCGPQCTFVLRFADDGDQGFGDEFEFKVYFNHTCKSAGEWMYGYPEIGYIDEPIEGPPIRSYSHVYDLKDHQYAG